MVALDDAIILNSPYDFQHERPSTFLVPEYILQKIEDGGRKGSTASVCNPTTGEETLYKDFENVSRKVASALFRRGFKKGDTLIYSSHDGARLHVFLLGAWRANGIVRTSYPEDVGGSLLKRIEESSSAWILCDHHLAANTLRTTRLAKLNVNIVNFGEPVEGCISAEEFFHDDGTACPALEVSPSDIALVMATSGTTGASKGAVYTHERLVLQLVASAHISITEDSSQPFLMLGKQTHFSGSAFTLSLMAKCQQLLIGRDIGEEEMLRIIQAHKPNGLFAFPSTITSMIHHPEARYYDLGSLSTIVSGGAVVSPAHVRAFKKLPGVQNSIIIYGMTETGILTTNGDYEAERVGAIKSFEIPSFSIGKLTPGTFLQVKDVDTGRSLGAGQNGELYFKCGHMSNGYLNLPKATEETFPGSWVRTGDLGYYDAQGYVYIVDRLKEVFKYRGSHVSPSEIEGEILCHPGVSGTCVIPVPDPGHGDSKMPKAFVVLKNPGACTAEDLITFANARLESYKHVRGGLEIVDSLPIGKTGKVLRSQLQNNNSTVVV